MPEHTPLPWFVDEDCHDDPENMIRQLQANAGTDREWIAVGLHDSDGYAESVAYCHPINAPVIAAAPKMLMTLKGILAYIEDGNVAELRPCGFVDEIRSMVAEAEKQIR